MKMRDILATLAYNYQGVLPQVLGALGNKQQVSEQEFNDFKRHCKYEYITIIDDNYPSILKNIANPPVVLFYKGNLQLLNDENHIIARCSDEGVRFFHVMNPLDLNNPLDVDYVMACECHDDMDMLLENMQDVLSTMNKLNIFTNLKQNKHFEN